MALMRRNPYYPFNEIGRMLDCMWALMEMPLTPIESELRQPNDSNVLAVDMTSDENNIVVRSALPGFKDDEVKVDVRGNIWTISAESKTEREDNQANWHIHELYYGKFARSMMFPEEVNTDKADASLENGILTIKLPKRMPGPVQKIAVKAKQLLISFKKNES
jgi:HSP20 family protein